jgi:hypothetical protein
MYSPLVIGPPQAQPKPLRDDLLLNLSPARLPGLVFTGASGRYQRESDGVLRSVGTDVPRSEHWIDGVRTWLLEGQRTNGWTYSEQLDNAVWSKGRVTISANATTAPDGVATADKVVEDTQTGAHFVGRVTGTIADSTLQATSFFGKAAERSWVRVVAFHKDGTATSSWINLSTGATGTVSASHTLRVHEIGSGWYRVEYVWNSLSGATTPVVEIHMATGDGVTSYTGDGASGLYLWGLQFEANQPLATSYIPTAGSSVGRNAESAPVAFPYAPQEMTVYCRFVEQGTLQTTSARLFQIGGGSGAAFIVLRSGGVYAVLYSDGTVEASRALSVAPTIGDTVEIRATLSPAGVIQIHQSINGAAETSSTESTAIALPAAWSDTKIWLNSVSTSGHGFNAFRNVIASRGIRTMAEMRARAS